MLNKISDLQQARQPRGMVKLNGIAVTGWVDWEVENNTFYQADTFRVSFAASGTPAGYGVDWFASQTTITVEIFAGFPDDANKFGDTDLTSLIFGNVDSINYDPVSGSIELTGRDLTSVLIDEKTTQKWPNLTASQIATQIAIAHGLTPVVTATKTKSGAFYQIDHARLTDQRSEWDLLTWLAHEESFSVYVKGHSLYFVPKVDPSAEPYVLQWLPPVVSRGYSVFNGTQLSFSRDLTVAKGIVVVVRSWNAKNKKAFTVTYPTNKAKGIAVGGSSPVAQIYSYTIAGLTPEKALQRAQAIHKERTAHEVNLTASLPADNILQTNNLILVSGTNTAFDQVYYPDSIRRTMSMSEGYMMSISAKNHSPANEVTI